MKLCKYKQDWHTPKFRPPADEKFQNPCFINFLKRRHIQDQEFSRYCDVLFHLFWTSKSVLFWVHILKRAQTMTRIGYNVKKEKQKIILFLKK